MELPLEMYQHIFEQLGPTDRPSHSAVYRTCKTFRDIYLNNKPLLAAASAVLLVVMQHCVLEFNGTQWRTRCEFDLRQFFEYRLATIVSAVDTRSKTMWFIEPEYDHNGLVVQYDPVTQKLTRTSYRASTHLAVHQMTMHEGHILFVAGLSAEDMHLLSFDTSQLQPGAQYATPERHQRVPARLCKPFLSVCRDQLWLFGSTKPLTYKAHGVFALRYAIGELKERAKDEVKFLHEMVSEQAGHWHDQRSNRFYFAGGLSNGRPHTPLDAVHCFDVRAATVTRLPSLTYGYFCISVCQIDCPLFIGVSCTYSL
eukprot:TRINITY_DN4825_c0_g1_i2.p1 TRINITY_DN4825_c0_g1~~TRINITY_DN4825_c0_g1_i2.p1  ORF type:complete len:312 (-),score=42.39 TRINITY_DN4825_c0_g1_i2:483-1418(-)